MRRVVTLGPLGLLVAATSVGVSSLATAPPLHRGTAACPTTSPVVCENRRPGTPERDWAVKGSGDPTIQGFATDISVDHGQTVHFKVDTPARRYHLDIFRLGFYRGDGARKVATVLPSAPLPQRQPPCTRETTVHVRLVDCGNWAESASWAVPRDAVSGVYFARLVRDDTRGASQVFFVVRDDERHSTVLFQTSDSTWEAYNDYGGTGIYTDPATAKVSYNRPFTTRTAEGGHAVESWVLYSEYPMIRWLEANGYDVSYFTSVDSDRFGAKLRDHRVVLSVGHDEYWSAGQRASFVAARDAGVNLAFFSGNTSYWKTRWEPSIDGSHQPYRTLVTYKESLANFKTDPTAVWTGLWRDPRFSPPADGGHPENALIGTEYGVYDVPALPLRVSADDGRLRLWRHTGLDRLPRGSSVTLAAQTLGYEWDWDADDASRPLDTADLSSTSGAPFTHDVTLYRASSGALVFSGSSVQWSWGLDAHHDASWDGRAVPRPDRRIRQATVNVLADLGAQPASLQHGLVRARPSTDRTAPTTTITRSRLPAHVAVGSAVTVTGTARDVGGAVATVEVSVDGGRTWHEAKGRSRWTYVFVPTSLGPTTVAARAVDDSANLGAPVSVAGPDVVARPCPCTLWSSSITPARPDGGVPGPHELGVRFSADADGYVLGIRFYKARDNTGTHVATLWSATGRQLATTTVVHESASGWQTATFPAPVPIRAHVTYVAAYHTNAGHFAEDPLYFDDWYTTGARGLDVPPLHAPWSRGLGWPNGVIRSGGVAFPRDAPPPDQFLDDANYWVEPVYATTAHAVARKGPTGTVENRNPATIAAFDAVEGSRQPRVHSGFLRHVLEAGAVAFVVLGVAVVIVVVAARRRVRVHA